MPARTLGSGWEAGTEPNVFIVSKYLFTFDLGTQADRKRGRAGALGGVNEAFERLQLLLPRSALALGPTLGLWDLSSRWALRAPLVQRRTRAQCPLCVGAVPGCLLACSPWVPPVQVIFLLCTAWSCPAGALIRVWQAKLGRCQCPFPPLSSSSILTKFFSSTLEVSRRETSALTETQVGSMAVGGVWLSGVGQGMGTGGDGQRTPLRTRMTCLDWDVPIGSKHGHPAWNVP